MSIEETARLVNKVNEKNVQPSQLFDFYNILQDLSNKGLSEKDIIVLIQSKTRPRITQSQVKATLDAIRLIEADIRKRLKQKP